MEIERLLGYFSPVFGAMTSETPDNAAVYHHHTEQMQIIPGYLRRGQDVKFLLLAGTQARAD